jgi:PAS domain S-box-containing protein
VKSKSGFDPLGRVRYDHPHMIMEIRFVPSLVVLSVVVAILASYVALNLAYTVTQAKGRLQAAWLAGGALAMGVGIWSMHFVGMLAMEMPGMEMAYHVPLLILSILVPVAASAMALFIVSRPVVPFRAVVVGGILMAIAIAGMHYIGMYSMRMSARLEWNYFLVAASVLIALVASFAALLISIKLRNRPDRLSLLIISAVLMGFAISGMHYTGMFAATFYHDETIAVHGHLLVSSGLTIAVLSTTLLILGLALAGSLGQRLWTLKAKRTEEVLDTSEEKFRLLVEAVKDYAIYMLSPEGIITTWNSGAQRITGYTETEIVGKHISTLYTAADIAANMADHELQEALANGHFEGEALRVRKDGVQFLANIVLTPLFNRQGTLTGFSKVIRDITELKRAERDMRILNEDLEKRVQERTLALQERENQIRTITNSLPALIAQFDKNEKILFANDAFCDWINCDSKNILGTSFKDLLGDAYPLNEKYVREALAGSMTTYERPSKSRGRRAVLNINLLPEFNQHNEVIGVVVLATDITRHKEFEIELKTAKEAAEDANNTKSAFLANMSHEIRTPLGAVLGFSELMAMEDTTAEERAINIEIIKRNGQLLSNIINDILDLSKVEAGKLEIEQVEVKPADLLNDLYALLNLEASGKGVQLKFSSEGQIPKVLKTDPTRLRQILFNIIGNAIKFTTRGSVTVTLKWLTSEDGVAKLAFVVADTGAGIQPEQAGRLFSLFTQADASTTRKFGGTGLGLVLSKKLANAMGGDVVLEKSEPGKGSVFVVTIDPGLMQDASTSAAEKAERKVLASSTTLRTAELKGLKVLVVDDSPDNQNLIRKLLSISGASVDLASNGREGFAAAMIGDHHVVLMDLQMPEMDGYEATRELRGHNYKKPIIALTAHAMQDERQRCLENGFDQHLTKPIHRETLIKTLAHYVQA